MGNQFYVDISKSLWSLIFNLSYRVDVCMYMYICMHVCVCTSHVTYIYIYTNSLWSLILLCARQTTLNNLSYSCFSSLYLACKTLSFVFVFVLTSDFPICNTFVSNIFASTFGVLVKLCVVLISLYIYI